MPYITTKVNDRPEAYGELVTTPNDLFEKFRPIATNEQESFWVVGFNTKHKEIFRQMISLGCIDETVVDMRILFRTLLLNGACAFAVIHNHPSGDKKPSSADKTLTKRIVEVSELLGLRFIDHMIVAEMGGIPYFSSYKEGW